jgi:hypothetical protein
MTDEDTRLAVEELTLMLLYLERWKERGMPDGMYGTWSGYDFDVIDGLVEKGDIYHRRGNKTIYMDGKGCDRARELLRKYGIEDWEKQF